LIDALADPTGSEPYLTPSGKPFEVGTRGFWKDYPNIENLVEELKLNANEIFTPFTESSFYSPNGLEAKAPVFSSSNLPNLPSPLGQMFATFSNFKRLPLKDRLTLSGLLYAMLDLNRDEATFEAYDRMTAHELFIRIGMSKRLVNDFVRPTLLVGLFKNPEELSAAVAMELLYFYALAHQDSFDVRWIKKMSIAEAIINPLSKNLQKSGQIEVLGGCRAEEIHITGEDNEIEAVSYISKDGTKLKIENVDACVLAVGAKGLKQIMKASPELSKVCPQLTGAASLNGIDVISTRIWFDGFVETDTPANVFSNFDELRGAGGTFFMLDQLQNNTELWGGSLPLGSVMAADFYNAGSLLPLSNKDLINLLTVDLLPKAVPKFSSVKIVDSYVVRCPGAVSWFSPGSYALRPPLEVSGVPNLVCAGDWVKMGDREHGSKGLCQERAFVSGLEAANALARKGALGPDKMNEHEVIPIRKDEPQVVIGREVNRKVWEQLNFLGISSNWIR